MEFTLTTPCGDCPFRRVGFIALRADRVREIAGLSLGPQGGMFACHKNVHHDEEDEEGDPILSGDEQHCAGAFIFAEKHDNPTQMMRIAERTGGGYDRRKLTGQDDVFDDLREMLRAHKEAL